MHDFCFIPDLEQIRSLVVPVILPETLEPLLGHNPASGRMCCKKTLVRIAELYSFGSPSIPTMICYSPFSTKIVG